VIGYLQEFNQLSLFTEVMKILKTILWFMFIYSPMFLLFSPLFVGIIVWRGYKTWLGIYHPKHVRETTFQ
jgi:hypothetical protein